MARDKYCAPLHDRFVDEIDTDDVLCVLKPIWLKEISVNGGQGARPD
jgi:hypothetical protein